MFKVKFTNGFTGQTAVITVQAETEKRAIKIARKFLGKGFICFHVVGFKK